MMDVAGQPDPKRQRLNGPGPPPPPQWQKPPERHLPPPGPQQQPAPYQQHNPPFSRPDHPLDRTHQRPPEIQYEPPQDARRPSSGPTHAFHSTHPPPPHIPPPNYAGQPEPVVKRDPSDEPQMQQYRPPSTGSGLENHVNGPMHQDPAGRYPPPGPPPPFDAARQPGPYPPPSPYTPQTPGPMSADLSYGQNIYGNSGLPPPHRQQDQYSVTYPQAGRPMEQQVRKKAQRAAQACDNCRTLKSKCDEGRPVCSACKEKGSECRYRDPPPKQQDKASADIMESLGRIQETMGSFQDQILRLTNEVNELKRYGVKQTSSPTGPSPVKQENEYPESSVRQSIQPYDHHRSSVSQAPNLNGNSYLPSPVVAQSDRIEEQPNPFRECSPSAEGEDKIDTDEDGDIAGPAKPPSIPVNHTTGAAGLISVKPIKEMCAAPLRVGERTKEIKSNFPFRLESNRGLLRLFGRGEGIETPPGYEKHPTMDNETSPNDVQSDVSSPATGEEWGQLGGLTPPANSIEISGGSINPDGMPDFRRETVIHLVRIYKREINNMHPLFTPSQLDKIVENFLKQIPDSRARPKAINDLQLESHPRRVSAGFAGTSQHNPESPGAKRKRSPGGEYLDPQVHQDFKPGHPFRNITAALVMLCMALGAICQHKEKIPPVHTDHEYEAMQRSSSLSSPVVRNGHPPSPLQGSPSMPAPFGTGSPPDHARGQPRSRRQSLDTPFEQIRNPTKPRNIDVIPGLPYFALASDVIGNQLGGNSLQHVHMNLLAGLYHGQLARVMESHAYIASACRSLQVILRPKMSRFKDVGLGKKYTFAKGADNGIIIAFWTCLQLESDIVAELPVPHSGILTFEEDMPTPNYQWAVEEDGLDPFFMESYNIQLVLRKHLNRLHNMFYKPNLDDDPFQAVLARKDTTHHPTIEASEENLGLLIETAAPNMLWDRTQGEPAEDILQARLRAKFYGAQVITYRNFLLQILDPKEVSSGVESEFISEINAPRIEKVSSIEDIDPKVKSYIKKGLKALIFSTKAFHGLGDPTKKRPIVTNVWGTAHAQWGNMLTLCAVWQHAILGSMLKNLISKETMTDLIQKTLGFLHLVGSPSSALAMDYKILDYAARRVGFLPPYGSSSFSSSSTGDQPMMGH